MIGNARGRRGYKLRDVSESKVVVSRYVRFDEYGETDSVELDSEINLDVDKPTHHQESEPPPECEGIHHNGDDDHSEEAEQDSQDSDDAEAMNDPAFTKDSEDRDAPKHVENDAGDVDKNGSRYPRRKRKRPGWWWESNGTALLSQATSADPRTFSEASSGPNGKEWMKSMTVEYNYLMENECWELVPRPTDANVIKSKWVYKTKEEQTVVGALGVRLKSRVVACGYSQILGVDFSETYVPVVKLTSILIVLSVTATLDVHLHQMDVVTAFLNGALLETIFMEQPAGFEKGDLRTVVCRLKKAIYGMKQAPRQWYAKIDDFFIRVLGMERDPGDECAYVRRQGGGGSLSSSYRYTLMASSLPAVTYRSWPTPNESSGTGSR